jgi:hypothetical protein
VLSISKSLDHLIVPFYLVTLKSLEASARGLALRLHVGHGFDHER